VVEEQVRILVRLQIGRAEGEEAALIQSRQVQRALGERWVVTEGTIHDGWVQEGAGAGLEGRNLAKY
jgi:hypothetical protein